MSEKNEIKAGKGDTPNAPVEAKTAPETKVAEDKVEVSRSQLTQILKDNEEFRKKIGDLESNAVSTQQGTGGLMRDKKDRSLLVNVRMWNDKFVVGFENMGKNGQTKAQYNEYDPIRNETKMFINVILQGQVKPVKLKYLEEYITGSVRVAVKVKEVKKLEPTITVQGMVSKKDFVENGYGTYETMVRVPLEVTEEHYAYLVDLNDEEVLLPSEVINN